MHPFPNPQNASGAGAVIGVTTQAAFGNIPLPAGAVAGDMCVMISASGGAGFAAITAASGFTSLFTAATFSSSAYWAGYKVLTGTDITNGFVPGPTGGGTASKGASIILLRGVTTPIASSGNGGPNNFGVGATMPVISSKSAKSVCILTAIIGAPDAAPAETLTSVSSPFGDPLIGGTWQGGVVAVAPSGSYANGQSITLSVSPAGVKSYGGTWDFPAP